MVQRGQLRTLRLARNVVTDGGVAALASALSSPLLGWRI